MPKKDPQKCREIRDRVDKWEKYWTINRTDYYEWNDFVMGYQWLEDESKLFERYNKMPIQNNKLGVLYNHMLGDQIQNTPNLQIMPDEDVPVPTAEARSALIKNISLNSDAKTQYQNAYGQAVMGGYGALRVGTDYINDKSLDQEIKIYSFTDPNMCYFDLSAKHLCKIDGMYAGFKTRMSRKLVRDRWGKDIESQIGTEAISENSTMAFADDDSITIVDDYEREGKKVIIRKLSDGSIVDEEEFKALKKEKIEGKRILIKDGQMVTVLDQRELVKYKIKHRRIAGDFILEETDFPSESLPVVYVDQKSYYTKQGQQITRSFFKDVKDAQRYLNYLATQSCYIMKISRYDQFIAPRKCVASPDVQNMWRDPGVVQGALIYDETPSNAKPEQLQPAQLSPSLIQQYQQTLMDIQSGTGIYDAQLGSEQGEISGTALDKRNVRGSKNTQIPRTSLDIAIATIGEIINEMIPKVYDTQRTLILPMPNSAEQQVEINKPVDPYGMQIENDMTQGRFKIRLKPGPSFEGQKDEALQSLQLVLNADRSGQIFPMIADLYAENLPLDNSLEIRNRLRTIVSPEIIEAGKTGKPLPPKPPQPDPQMLLAQLKQQELQQKAQKDQQDAQIKMQDLQHKQAELQRKAIESQHEMDMAYAKIEAEKQEAAAELQSSILRYNAENQRIGADLQMNHSDHLVRMLEHTGKIFHEKDMQSKEHSHQSKHKSIERKHET